MPEQPTARRGPNIVLLVVLGIALMGIVAVLATRSSNSSDSAPSTGSGASATDGPATTDAPETHAVDVTGALLPALADPDDDPVAGTNAPVVQGESFGGDAVTIGKPGTPQVIVFVAHWCPHCQREVPFLVGYFKDHGMPKGVDVFGVATSIDATRPNYPPSQWLERARWTVPTLADDEHSTAATAFGLSAFPFFVAIHADGTVAARVSGELEAPQLEALITAAKG